MPIHRTLVQGSRAWLDWRRDGVGASDAPVVMGVSPWRSAHALWLEKTGQGAGAAVNAAMRRGQAMEAEARERYIAATGVSVAPACLEHDELGWMRASLDGLSADGTVAVEIKCPGQAAQAIALRGEVPEHYLPQLQHQLAVARARECHYWSYRHGRGALLVVRPDARYHARLIEAEREFWEHVRERRPLPPP